MVYRLAETRSGNGCALNAGCLLTSRSVRATCAVYCAARGDRVSVRHNGTSVIAESDATSKVQFESIYLNDIPVGVFK